MNACAIASPTTPPASPVPTAPVTVPGRPPPVATDVRVQAARVVATTRRHWLDAAP